MVGREIGKELNHFSLAGGRKLALLRSQVELEPNVFDDLGGLGSGLLEVEAQAVVGAPDVPKVAEDSCLCFGREEEEEVIDVLFLDWKEGQVGLAEEGLEHVMEPYLESPGGTGLAHRDPGRDVVLSVDLETEVCL